MRALESRWGIISPLWSTEWVKMIEKGKNNFTSPTSPLPKPRTEKHQEQSPWFKSPPMGKIDSEPHVKPRACPTYLETPFMARPPCGLCHLAHPELCLCWLVNGFPCWHHSVKTERDCCLVKRAESNRRHRNHENQGTMTPPKGKSKASVIDPKEMDIYHWLIRNPK